MSSLQVNLRAKVFPGVAQAPPHHALASIKLTIKHGQFACITGPSGCGKSTLLSLLGLLDTQSSGSFMLNDTNTDNLAKNERAKIKAAVNECETLYESIGGDSRYLALYNRTMGRVLHMSRLHKSKADLLIERLKRVTPKV